MPEQAAQFPPGLREFLAESMAGQPWPETAAATVIAGRELYVEEPVLGQPTRSEEHTSELQSPC